MCPLESTAVIPQEWVVVGPLFMLPQASLPQHFLLLWQQVQGQLLSPLGVGTGKSLLQAVY